jgi:O-antigen/teichoic acid export membrane protein
LRQVIPLLLGFTILQFLFTADTMFAKAYFDGETVAAYGAAGTLSRALMWLVGPLATVMFPRIVHSTAKAEKSDILGMVLAGTAIMAMLGAISLTLLGPWVITMVNGPSYVKATMQLLPWYAFLVVPLSVGNVLLNNLMARGSFRVVPWLCVMIACYAIALTRFNATPVMLLQTLGVFNLVLLTLCAVFTWRDKREAERRFQPVPEAV